MGAKLKGQEKTNPNKIGCRRDVTIRSTGPCLASGRRTARREPEAAERTDSHEADSEEPGTEEQKQTCRVCRVSGCDGADPVFLDSYIFDAAEFQFICTKRHLALNLIPSPSSSIRHRPRAMPVPTAPSSAGRSRTQTPMSYEKFRPKFPIDPFVGVDQTSPSAREPWSLDVDNLPLPSILQHERRVILVIGRE